MARETVETIWAENNPSGVVAPSSGTQENGYGAVKPPFQEHNWVFQKCFDMLQNAEQLGIMEWSTDTEYPQYGLATGSDGEVYKSQIAANQGNDPTVDSGTNWLAWKRNGLLHVRDEKTVGTEGGSFSSGAEVTRVLNTTTTNTIAGASRAGNVITLPAGTFDVYATFPAFDVNQHQAKMRNATSLADVIIGTTENTTGSGTGISQVQTRSIVSGRITLAASTDFDFRHECSTGDANGLGRAAGFNTEVYSDVQIREV